MYTRVSLDRPETSQAMKPVVVLTRHVRAKGGSFGTFVIMISIDIIIIV